MNSRTIGNLSAITIIGIVIVLAGCGSFNNSFNTYHLPLGVFKADQTKETGQETILDIETLNGGVPTLPLDNQSPSSQGAGPCSVGAFVFIGRIPELPSKDLQEAAKITDPLERMSAFEKIERKHIDELRSFISEIKLSQRVAVQEFYRKCEALQKK